MNTRVFIYMHYTVHKLAEIAGVSVRTLHYYDEIGLLKPAEVAQNGYRYYGEKELAKLQQILFFRELEFPLERIKQMMQSPYFDPVEALHDQKKLIALKRKKLDKLIRTIDTSITHMQKQTPLNDDSFSAFNDSDYLNFKDEVQERWGNTDAYKQSQEKLKKMTKDDIAKLKEDGIRFAKQLAKVFLSGVSAASEEMQQMVDQHYNSLRMWYEPNMTMYRGLADMYVNDPRFTAYYDKHAKGLTAYLREAMLIYADRHQK